MTRTGIYRKLCALLTIGVLAVAVTSACTGTSSRGSSDASLTIAIGSDVDTWSPQDALTPASYQVFPQVFGTLIRTTPDGNSLLPALASSYNYDAEARTITFSIDPNAAFSNGDRVDSSDVKFSFDVWRSGATYGSYFSSIVDVDTPDSATAVFKLSEPDVTLLGILATTNAAIYPENYGGLSAEEYWKRPVGAGPFIISEEVKGDSITLTRNSHYYRKNLPVLDKVVYKIVSDVNQQLLQFQGGAVDIVNGVTQDMAAQYSQDKIVAAPSSGVTLMIPRSTIAPLDNPDFRRALNLAVVHTTLLAGGYSGQATEVKSILPSVIPGVEPCAECNWSRTDVVEARKLVSQSGYTGETLELIVASESSELFVAQAMTPMLADAGINVTVIPVPISGWIDRLGNGDFQLAMFNFNALTPSPADPLGLIASTNNLFAGSDPAAAQLALTRVQAASAMSDVSAATGDFEKHMFSDTTLIPLAVPNSIFAVSNRVAGFVHTPYSVYVADELSIG